MKEQLYLLANRPFKIARLGQISLDPRGTDF